MGRKNLQELLTEHYVANSISADTATRLTSLAALDLGIKETVVYQRRTKQRILFAAGLALFAFIAGYAMSYSVRIQESQSAVLGEVIELPSLVAVKVRADWCTRTPVVEPIFTGLTEKYGGEPILFVTMDITDENGRRQARYMASNLGIDWIFDTYFESGMIKVIDRRQESVLATLTTADQSRQVESLLAQALR